MRKGNNPMKGGRIYRQAEVVAGVITHLPNLEGYHAGRLEVIQTCLTSLRERAGRDLQVMIWDNGSGPELREWLMREYRPEFLTLAPNMGKAFARAAIIRSFPAGTVVCMSDDDIFYHPNWLEPQMQLLETWPNVGTVSGYQVRTSFRWGNGSTIKWAEGVGAKITRGKIIPEEWDRDWCFSIGRDYEMQKVYTQGDQDILIEWNGMEAFATSHHCQFICYAGRLAEIAPMYGQGWALSDEKVFDQNVDAAGLLRLATRERLVQHIGNVMEERFQIGERVRGEV